MENTLPQKTDLLIIGGGLSGLSAALHLAERGLTPLVIDADPKFIGGRVSGGDEVEINGWRFRGEHGVHGIWAPYRNLQAMLARNQIRPVFVPANEETWIFKKGPHIHRAPVGSAIRHSWLPAPFHYLALFLRPSFLKMLSISDWLSLPFVWYGLIFALGIDPLREDQPMEGLKLTDLTKRWAPAVQAFITGLARNGLAAKPGEVQLAGFLAFLRFYTVLRRDSWAFSYLPADGGSALAEVVARRICELGGKIISGFKAKELVQNGNSWDVMFRTAESDETLSVRAGQIVLAIDAPSAAKLLSESPTTHEIARDLYWPRGMETAVIRVWFNELPKTGAEAGIFTGDFILHNFFWLSKLQDQYIRWSKATGGSCIEVHIYGPPETLALPDSVILAQAIKDIQDAFPELRGHRLHQLIQRNQPTHTLFSIGPVEKHLGTITPWENLYSCGDWIHHTSPAFFLERACVTGIAAANEILATSHLVPWKLLDYPQPEPVAGFLEKLMRKGRQFKRWRKQKMAPNKKVE